MIRACLAALAMAAGLLPVSTLAAQTTGPQAPVVTLGEARRRAAVVDPNAIAARAQVASAGWERRAARMDLFTPNVALVTTYARATTPLFGGATDDGFIISNTATSATLQGRYTLLGDGKLSSLKRARASLESAEASETAVRFRTALETDMAYFAVLADRELLRVATERLARAREQFGIARVRVSAGDVLATDSLQLLLEVNRAQLALLRQDSALAVSRLRLGRRIGLPGQADAAPIDTTLPAPLPLSEEELIREMRQRGPDIEAARAAERRASAVVATEREGYFPDIILSASKAASDSVLFPSAVRSNQFAVSVSLPIWDGGQRELSVARARLQRDIARAERDDRERAAAELMTEAYHGYRTARAGTELALVGVRVAAETYRVQGVRYREGATTILDLLEAQIALSEAEAALVQSRYATHLGLAQIEALLGRRLADAAPTNR
jgi:outer membrane protein